MSKKMFDLLLTEKEIIMFFEKTIIRMDNGELVGFKEKQRIVIPVANLIFLFLGTGTSITQEAAIFAAYHDCYVAFSRGGAYVHSIWHSGRWSDPKRIVNQSLMHSNKEVRLDIAKKLILKRMINENLDIYTEEKINNATKINELLGYEASWAKKIYKTEAVLSNINDFKRNFDSNDIVNMRLNLLNNAFYGLTTAIIIATGLHPSIGFIHGQSRRGGLSFDIADIYKLDLTIKPSFRTPQIIDNKRLLYDFNYKLKDNNDKILKEIVELCLKIGEGDKNI